MSIRHLAMQQQQQQSIRYWLVSVASVYSKEELWMLTVERHLHTSLLYIRRRCRRRCRRDTAAACDRSCTDATHNHKLSYHDPHPEFECVPNVHTMAAVRGMMEAEVYVYMRATIKC